MTEKTKKTQPKKTSSATIETPMHVANLARNPRNRRALTIVAILIVLAVFAYKLRGEYIVAMVNGSPITRVEIIGALEQQAGQQALDTIILKRVIRQEAQKANIVIKQEDVDKEINDLEKQLKEQGQNFDDFLKQQGLTREVLKEQAELQLMLDKLTEKDVKVTQKEIDKTFEEQKSLLKDNKELTEKDLREQITESLTTQKKQAAVQAWVQSAREKANIVILKQF